MKIRKANLGLALFSLAFATFAVGCDLSEIADVDKMVQSENKGIGTLELRLKNAPAEEVEAVPGLESVYVTFSEIAVHYCEAKGKDDDDDDRDDDRDEADDRDEDDGEDKDDKDGKKDRDGGDDDGDEDDDDDWDDDDDSDDDDDDDDDDSHDGAGGDQGSEPGVVARDGNTDKGQKSGDKQDKLKDKKKEAEKKVKGKKGKKKGKKQKPKWREACENGEWKRIKLAESGKFDLLALAKGNAAGLGVSELPAGHYGQIRLKLESASVVFNGQEMKLDVPSGMKAGLKIKGGFEVVKDEKLALNLDFSALKSVKLVKGKGWLLKPVIRLIK